MRNARESTRRHYETGEQHPASLVDKVRQILDSLPAGPVNSSQLAGLDQFHVRGLSATAELAKLASLNPSMVVLDAGSGLGGPSRYLAEHFGCTVFGVDLAPSFVAVSQLLAERTGLAQIVRYQIGDITALPFANEKFDVVWTQHAVMNIRDREKAYREFRRVLKPSGKVLFYDVVAADHKPELDFPVPWAESAESSFLLTKAETLRAFQMSDFTLGAWNDVTPETIAWFERQGQPSPQPLSLATVMGPRFAAMAANLTRNVRAGRVRFAAGIFDAARRSKLNA